MIVKVTEEIYEIHNLIHSSAHEGVCLVLAEKLKKCMEEAGEEVPVIYPAPKRKTGQLMVFEGEENL